MSDPHAPRPYDLSNPDEVKRLIRECRGYIHTCQASHHGADLAGRRFALEALTELADSDRTLTISEPGRDLPVYRTGYLGDQK